MGVRLLDDGYVFRAAIDATPGMHGALKFSMRPMLPADVEDAQASVDREIRGGRPRAASTAAATTIARYVVDWDVTTKQGVAPITVENVARLPPALFNKLLLVLYGSRPSDRRDDWTPEEQEEWQRGGLLSVIEGGQKN